MEHEGEGETNCGWSTWNDPQMIGKGMEDLEIGGQVETILTKALLRSVRILRRVLVIWGDLLSLKFQRETIC